MNEQDKKLEIEISRTWREIDDARPTSFDATWRAAQARCASRRRRTRGFSAAALLAVVVIGINLSGPPADDVTYIEVAELLESTSWSAPSDVLLPTYEFDIYQELPSLIESTDSAGGSLL